MKAYFEHLDDWFYKEYSQSAHLSFPGLSRRGGPFLLKEKAEREENLKKNKSDAIFSSVTLTLAIASEVESICRFDFAEKLKYLWTLVGGFWPEANKLYSMRYCKLLSNG